MDIQIKKLSFYVLIVFLINSCKSYKEFIIENSCGNKKIELTKERPFKVKEKKTLFVLSFDSGFSGEKVQVLVNDSIYMDKRLISDGSTSHAGSFVLDKYVRDKIKIKVNNQCFDFQLDENYTYYEIHNSEKKFYLNIQHFPSIGE